MTVACAESTPPLPCTSAVPAPDATVPTPWFPLAGIRDNIPSRVLFGNGAISYGQRHQLITDRYSPRRSLAIGLDSVCSV